MTAKEEFEEKLEKSKSDSKNEPERKLWEGGYSPRAMYGTWAFSGLLTIVGLVAVGLTAAGNSTAWMIAGAAILLWWVVVIGIFLYRKLGMRYELTTQRFIHQTGILVRQTDRIEVIDIDDVSYTQGIIQRMLGVGTIQIMASDTTHPELVMYGIEKVPEIAGLIDDVRREERRRRSLHIEQI